jgi:hypothetical protein
VIQLAGTISPSTAAEPPVPPGAPRWVTPELIDRTRRYWGPKYAAKGRHLSRRDALQIILNYSHLIDAIQEIK